MKAPYNAALFVNREQELAYFYNAVLSVPKTDNSPSEKVIHLIGRSNVGKSYLLQKFYDVLSRDGSQSFFTLYITLEEYLTSLSDNFIIKVLKFICEKVAEELNIKSPFLETTPNVYDYSSWILRSIEQVQKKKTFVLLLDEVSMLSSDQIEALEDYFLAGFINLPNTVLILTGRYAVSGWKDFSLRPTANGNVIELLGFDLYYTQKQIEILGPQAVDLAPEIFRISGGSPGNNRTILDQAGGDPLQINEVDTLQACNQDLYDAIAVAGQTLPHDSAVELLPALEALCVLQGFDKEYEMPMMLAAHTRLQGAWEVRRSAALLSILSGIQVGPGKLVGWDERKSAYVIEEQIRFNLEQEIKIRDNNLWVTLHCTAMKMYAQWASEYGTDFFVTKLKYHKSQLEQAGINLSDCNII